MASTISHDLRHPLTAILAYAEFLSEGNLTEHQRKDFFDEIRIAVNRMTDEINSLLGFSRQREAIRPVFGNMEDVIERAIQTVKVLPEFQAIQISFSRSDVCAAWFDPGKVERVMLNLLFNACEAVAPEGGRIEVTCRTTEAGSEIVLADNGPGIPEAIRGELFQPFVSAGKEKGIGLGLTVVQKIMQNHGGEVRIESTGPEGTVFKLIFPARIQMPDGDCVVRQGML
jgi:signal transduction histidine kinase